MYIWNSLGIQCNIAFPVDCAVDFLSHRVAVGQWILMTFKKKHSLWPHTLHFLGICKIKFIAHPSYLLKCQLWSADWGLGDLTLWYSTSGGEQAAANENHPHFPASQQSVTPWLTAERLLFCSHTLYTTCSGNKHNLRTRSHRDIFLENHCFLWCIAPGVYSSPSLSLMYFLAVFRSV